MSDHLTSELRGLAEYVDDALQNERADRQTIAETALDKIRYLALVAAGEATFGRPQPAASAEATNIELAAGTAAAAAALNDYLRWQGAQPTGTGSAVDWQTWAARLANALAYLLAVLDATALVLKGSQLETLRQALTDAVAHRDPGGLCEDCEIHPAGLCTDHADDLDRSDAYLALAAELGIEVER